MRKAGNRVRVSVQLIDSGNGFQLWSEDFEGDIQDVFGVQERTALKIAEALSVRLTPQEQRAVARRYTGNAQAYDEYLRGRALVEFFNIPEKLEAARQHFERALASDPKYALALAGVSRVEAQYYRNLDANPVRLDRAERYAGEALRSDPQLAEAHLALGQIYANRFDYGKAAQKFREATRIEAANPYAWDLLSWALAYQQPPEPVESEQAARESIRLNPSLFGAHYHLARALLLQDRFEESLAALDQAGQLNPDPSTVEFGRAQVYLAQKQYRQALDQMARASQQRARKTPIFQFVTASAHAGLGEREKALAALEKALAGGYRDFPAIESSPHLAPLRADPRLQRLLDRYRK